MMFKKKSGLRIAGMMLLAAVLTFCPNDTVKTVYATQTSQTQGSDAYLKTFSATPGTMSPDFSSMVTNYTITVSSDVDQLSVTCSTADANAQVTEAKGFKNLQLGNNKATIKVKGASGTICTYNFTIVKGNMSAATNPAEGASITLATGKSSQTSGTTTSGTTSTTQNTTQSTTNTVTTDTENTASEATDSVDDTQDDSTEDGQDAAVDETTSEEVVETMAPVADSGERYLVGGDSIYADYYVVPTFDSSLLPDGFVVENYNFNGNEVQSAYLAAGDIRLLFSESAEGTNGGLRIYYEDDKDMMDFVPFLGYSGYVFPVRYQAQIPVPTNYTGSYMPFDKKVVACYIYTELTNNPISVQAGMETKDTLQPGESTADADPVSVDSLDEMPEFYLFYGMNNNGEENFYLYDWKEGTYQRYVERDTSYDLDQSYFKYKDMAHQRFVVMCTLFVLLLLAVFFIINLYMKNRELKRDLEEYDPDYDGPDDGGDGYDDEEYDGEDDIDDEAYDGDEDDIDDGESDEEYGEDESDEEADDVTDDSEEEADEELQEDIAEYGGEEMRADEPDEEEEASEEPDASEDAEDEEDSMEEQVDSQEIVRKRRPEFKMINLSREPEPTGIDDDFEFEFIHFEDD